jgi:hypothetical protein
MVNATTAVPNAASFFGDMGIQSLL